MKGKRFSTPNGDRAVRQSGYAQPHSFSTPSAGRWGSPTGVPERLSREEPHNSHVRSQLRPSGGGGGNSIGSPHASYMPPTPERRPHNVMTRSTHSSMPGTSVHHMLSELVDLSQSIAALLEQEAVPPAPALTSSSSARQKEAGLKTQEIERIVRRVEAHFVDKVQTLEATNTTLKDEVRHLREALKAQSRSESVKAAATQDVRGGLREEIEALDALDRAWTSEGNGTAPLTEAEQLRRVLLAEKRQRLRVEEQTQSLTEQHAKVVGTLERRLKKQEEQLYDLIAAIDRGCPGGPASPTRSTDRGSSHRLPTPRHLLRQQLAQHQQTQRALQEYKENLRYESPSPSQSDDVAAMEELGLDDVRRTLESIRSSKPLTVKEHTLATPKESPAVVPAPAPLEKTAAVLSHDEPEIVYTSVTAAPTPQAPPSQPHRSVAMTTREVDEITNFLDNITKELESLDAA